VSKPSAGSRTADASKSLSMRKIVGWFVASIVLVLAISARAFAAAPAASIPTGPFTDGQVITVSGSGFPTHSQDPAGLQIIECSDPQGSAANLPTDAGVGCEGISVNAGQINTDSAGKFRTAYLVAALSTKAGTSSIDCDAAHYCVLWVGTDYNNAFTSGPHAFTTPFEVNENTTTGTPPSQTNTTAPPSDAAGSSGTTPGVGTAGSSVTLQGSLASTGVPGLVPWLLGLGLLMALLGTLVRCLTAGRAR